MLHIICSQINDFLNGSKNASAGGKWCTGMTECVTLCKFLNFSALMHWTNLNFILNDYGRKNKASVLKIAEYLVLSKFIDHLEFS